MRFIKFKTILFLSCAILFQPNIVFADPTKSPTLCAATNTIKSDPVMLKLYSTNNNICKNIAAYLLSDSEIDLDEIFQNLKLALIENKNVILEFFDESNSIYPQLETDITVFMDNFISMLKHKITTNKQSLELHSVAVANDKDFKPIWEVSGSQLTMDLSRYEQSGICNNIKVDGKDKKYSNCKEAFDAISKGINTYRSGYDTFITDSNTKLLDGLKNEWNRYSEKARNQTWLDENFDFLINSKHYSKDHLVGPAKIQYFLLHPSLVYEWVDSDPEGQKDKASAALEIVGFNRWNSRVPWGLSFMAVASDRVNFEPVSLGLGTYIDNTYSLGVTYRQAKNDAIGIDDEWSVYVNIDLLNFGIQRKKQLEKYTQKLKSL